MVTHKVNTWLFVASDEAEYIKALACGTEPKIYKNQKKKKAYLHSGLFKSGDKSSNIIRFDFYFHQEHSSKAAIYIPVTLSQRFSVTRRSLS